MNHNVVDCRIIVTGMFEGEWLSGKRAERGDGMETGMKEYESKSSHCIGKCDYVGL